MPGECGDRHSIQDDSNLPAGPEWVVGQEPTPETAKERGTPESASFHLPTVEVTVSNPPISQEKLLYVSEKCFEISSLKRTSVHFPDIKTGRLKGASWAHHPQLSVNTPGVILQTFLSLSPLFCKKLPTRRGEECSLPPSALTLLYRRTEQPAGSQAAQEDPAQEMRGGNSSIHPPGFGSDLWKAFLKGRPCS